MSLTGVNLFNMKPKLHVKIKKVGNKLKFSFIKTDEVKLVQWEEEKFPVKISEARR